MPTQPLPKKIDGRLREIVMKRWGNPNFTHLAKEFYNSLYTGKYMNKYQWRSATGAFFYVDEMQKSHLVNTLNLLTGKKKTNYIPDEHFNYCKPDNLNRDQWINIFMIQINKINYKRL